MTAAACRNTTQRHIHIHGVRLLGVTVWAWEVDTPVGGYRFVAAGVAYTWRSAVYQARTAWADARESA